MRVGAPTEVKPDEYRVALTPAGVRELVDAGHEVLVQSGAGLGSAISDDAYRAQGAQVATDAATLFAEADMIVKVKEPQPQEVQLLEPRHTLFTYLHLAADTELTRGHATAPFPLPAPPGPAASASDSPAPPRPRRSPTVSVSSAQRASLKLRRASAAVTPRPTPIRTSAPRRSASWRPTRSACASASSSPRPGTSAYSSPSTRATTAEPASDRSTGCSASAT